MEKEKMIEEIENILFEYDCHEVSAPWVHIKYAHEIIDAIIPEGSVVLTKEEYVKFKKNVRENEFYALYNEIDQARKETAREIFEKIHEKEGYYPLASVGTSQNDMIGIAKVFGIKYTPDGVEVEE